MEKVEFGIPRSRIPVACHNEEIVIGIDEAGTRIVILRFVSSNSYHMLFYVILGRGPVLGSLVYCACFWPVRLDAEIQNLAFNDSKQMKESERDKMLQTIISHESIGWVVEELPAVLLSEEMLKATPVSLNAISYDAVIRILSNIRDAHPHSPVISNIYIDTVGDPDTYKNRLTRSLGNDFANFTIEKKADATYKVVGAASIIAKVVRDKLLSTWTFPEQKFAQFDKCFGSGYPGDPECVKWLEKSQEKVFGYPNLVRFSWSTTREILIKHKAVNVSWECEEEDTGGSAEITSFFGAAGEKRPKRSPYFNQRKMKYIIPSDINN